MVTHTTELQIKNFLIFIENMSQPYFGCHRDDAGVVCIHLYRLRVSIYGRRFNRSRHHQ